MPRVPSTWTACFDRQRWSGPPIAHRRNMNPHAIQPVLIAQVKTYAMSQFDGLPPPIATDLAKTAAERVHEMPFQVRSACICIHVHD